MGVYGCIWNPSAITASRPAHPNLDVVEVAGDSLRGLCVVVSPNVLVRVCVRVFGNLDVVEVTGDSLRGLCVVVPPNVQSHTTRAKNPPQFRHYSRPIGSCNPAGG